MDSPWCDGLIQRLPGDASEKTEADDEAEGSGEEDGPGVGGEAGAKGGHGGVSLDSAVHTKKVWDSAAWIFNAGVWSGWD